MYVEFSIFYWFLNYIVLFDSIVDLKVFIINFIDINNFVKDLDIKKVSVFFNIVFLFKL